MKQIFFLAALFISASYTSCNSNNANASNNKENVGADHTTSSSSTSTPAETSSSASKDDETSASPLLDTGKLQSDLNDMMSAVTSGSPDTTKLKNAGADILSTDAAMLSDSGIDKLYGNSNDPSVVAAKNSLKKMRDGMGITPDKLDSIKKAAAELKQKTSH